LWEEEHRSSQQRSLALSAARAAASRAALLEAKLEAAEDAARGFKELLRESEAKAAGFQVHARARTKGIAWCRSCA